MYACVCVPWQQITSTKINRIYPNVTGTRKNVLETRKRGEATFVQGPSTYTKQKEFSSKTISFAKLSMGGISTRSCKYKWSYRDFFFFHCNTNLFSRFRNYVNLQDIWCNWPNVSKKLFNDKYLAWYTLCQSNGCMKSLQIFRRRKKKNGLLVWISTSFFFFF